MHTVIVSISQKHATSACVIPEVIVTAAVEFRFCLVILTLFVISWQKSLTHDKSFQINLFTEGTISQPLLAMRSK